MDATGAPPPAISGQPPADGVSLPPAPKPERLSQVVQQQLNLESVKTRAVGLYKAISRILEDFELYARANTDPKWEDVLGQFSMVSMELFNAVEDIKNVLKAFVVYPKNVNAENATILPVMLSSKLLPEMEVEDNSRREQLLCGISSLPVHAQNEKLKARIDMISAACDAAEKVIADCRKAYMLGTRQGPSLVPTLDKVQAAKIQEQETLLRAAANFGEGLRLPPDQKQLHGSLPSHLVDVLNSGDGAQTIGDNSGVYPKSASAFSSNTVNTQGAVLQNSAQLMSRSVPSPSGAAFENVSTPPIPYANSPRSSTNLMNTPSPQQVIQQQQQQQQQQHQQQRQKMMQLPQNQQQLLAQQQMRNAGVLGQTTISQLHDLQGQNQQKFQQVPGQPQMQYSQPMSQQQFQSRQLQSAQMQHNIAQNQLNQGNQLRSHLNQFTGVANSAMFNAAQTSPSSQMLTNMSAQMQSQSLLPRVQFGLPSGSLQRNHPSQILNDQMFGMGASNPTSMMQMHQQQQGGYGSIPSNNQNLQPGMGTLPNSMQNPHFPQQRQQNQQ